MPPRSSPLYGLDIETDTAVNGLDPRVSAVLAVAVSSERGEVVLGGDEPALLERLDDHLATLPPGTIATWNGGAFDLPFLAHRAALMGVPLGLRLVLDPTHTVRQPLPGHEGAYAATWHGHAHVDGYRLYRADVGRALPVSCALKSIARLVGLPSVEVDASRVHELAASELCAYVASDARLARLLVARRVDARWPAPARGPTPVRARVPVRTGLGVRDERSPHASHAETSAP